MKKIINLILSICMFSSLSSSGHAGQVYEYHELSPVFAEQLKKMAPGNVFLFKWDGRFYEAVYKGTEIKNGKEIPLILSMRELPFQEAQLRDLFTGHFGPNIPKSQESGDLPVGTGRFGGLGLGSLGSGLKAGAQAAGETLVVGFVAGTLSNEARQALKNSQAGLNAAVVEYQQVADAFNRAVQQGNAAAAKDLGELAEKLRRNPGSQLYLPQLGSGLTPDSFFRSQDPQFLSQALPIYDRVNNFPARDQTQSALKDLSLGALKGADDFSTGGRPDEAKAALELAKEMADVLLGIDPYTGTVRDILESATGKNIVTGADLTPTERAISVGSAALDLASFGVVPSVGKASRAVYKTLKNSKLLNPADLEKMRKLIPPVSKLFERLKDHPAFLKSLKWLRDADKEGLHTLEKLSHATDVGKWPFPGKPPRIAWASGEDIALIGRGMKEQIGVKGAKEYLEKQGIKVHIFEPSKEALEEFDELIKRYGPKVPDHIVEQSRLFKEDRAWTTEIHTKRYTTVDMGNPLNFDYSIFYDMETEIRFGKGQWK